MRTIGVALLGLGNVGGGVVKLLEDNAEAIEARLGARIAVRAIVGVIPTRRIVSSRSIASSSRPTSRARSSAQMSTSCAS
jgi:homoserine dehydrogenase